MEEDGVEAPTTVFTLRILQIVQTAQSQHGLRHNDYERYRRYCFKRLRRLYLSLKFLHGKGRFVKKKVEPSMVTENRFLLIPLMNAERAWAYAMQLKNMTAEQPNPRKRLHLIRRLAKAVVWSKDVVSLASERFDSQTILEAEAYSAWMHALLLSEKETNWSLALAKHLRAKELLETLSTKGDFALQKNCRHILQLIEPAIRFCKYQIERSGAAVPNEKQLVTLADDGATRMAELQARAGEMTSSGITLSSPASSSAVTWRGTSYAVHSDKAAAVLLSAQEVEAALNASMDADAADDKVKLYDSLVDKYQEAVKQIQQELQLGTGEVDELSPEEVHKSLQALLKAVRGLWCEASREKYIMMAASAEYRFERMQQRTVLGTKAKGKDKPVKAADLVKLYDSVLSCVSELSELAGEMGGPQGELLMDECAAEISHFEATGCFYVAHTFMASNKNTEAFALFDRCISLADKAIERHQECARVNEDAVRGMQQLVLRAKGLRCAVHAECYAQQLAASESVQHKVGALGLTDKSPEAGQVSDKFLANNMDKWESYAGEDGRDPRLAQIPPPLVSIPVRPIFLDAAESYLQLPSLSHRYKTVQKASTFARFFSWSGR